MSTATTYLYKRFQLNKRLVEVRRVEDGANPELVIRYVDDDDGLSKNEVALTLRFFVKYAKPVRKLP